MHDATLSPAGVSRCHSYQFRRLPTVEEWGLAHQALSAVPRMMVSIPLGDPPNPFFAKCALGTQIKVGIDGMTVRGAGLHRRSADGPSYPMGGGPLHISRHLPSWSVETYGRPYDRVVRLALHVLRMALPNLVQLQSTATEHELVETAAIIFAARLGASKDAAALVSLGDGAAGTDERIQVSPLNGEPNLYRVTLCGVDLAPLGDLAGRARGRVGFVGRSAAFKAAAEAFQRFGLSSAKEEAVT